MLLENLSFTNKSEKEILVDVDGVQNTVPVKVGNSIYDEIQKQIADETISAIPLFTTQVAHMDELRVIRKAEMNRIDNEKANATKYNNMSAGDKTATDDWYQDMRDLPKSQAAIDGVAALDPGDDVGLKALLTTLPAILA